MSYPGSPISPCHYFRLYEQLTAFESYIGWTRRILSYRALEAIMSFPLSVVWGAVLIIVAKLVYNKLVYGIKRLPGPPLAAYTGLWRVFQV